MSGCPLSDGALQCGIAGRHQLRYGVDDRYLCISTAKSLMRNAIDSKETSAP